MFYYVEGTVALVEPALAVIDCGGVGYACSTSRTTACQLKPGKRARLYTHLSVREDAVQLFGFLDPEELSCFRMLIGVSGVGPKAALAILSESTPAKLALAIITEDERVLQQAPGIGKKIAKRIVLELRDKMSREQLETAGSAAGLELPAAGGCGAAGAGLQSGGSDARDGGLPHRGRGGRRHHPLVPEKAGGHIKGADRFEHRIYRGHGG